ncbi:MAG: fasciclin domain-containing protein [Mycobacterium sp.]
MTTRTKTIGVAAALAAIAFSIPTAVTAYADDPTPSPAPTATSAVSTPVAPIPDPQGPGCDGYKKTLPPGGAAVVATESVTTAIANNPDLSTFSAAINGGLNPAVNVASVLDNGPYIVFAPTNDAFAKLDPAQLEALKADPAALTSLVYYHSVLGLLGADDVHGKLTTQQGKQITVTGKGGDIKVDDVAKVVCGDIEPMNARIYMIDTVLDPATSLGPNETTATSTTTTTTTTSETTTPETVTSEVPAPVPGMTPTQAQGTAPA